MKKQSPNDSLGYTIALLEIKRDQEFKALSDQFHVTYESLKPVNMLKSAFKEVTGSADLKHDISSAAIGVSSGYLLKKIFFRPTLNPLKMLAGIVLQTVATNIAAKHSDQIKSSGFKILNAVAGAFTKKKNIFSENEIYE
jgi:hypothetical protein